MSTAFKVIAVHGIGHQTTKSSLWQPQWERAIEEHVAATSHGRKASVQFPQLDDIFADYGLGTADWLEAVGRLSISLLQHKLSDFFAARRRSWRDDASHFLRWYIGMVAQWAAQEKLRADLRERVANEVAAFGCDLLIGHSLGSLVCYDLLVDPERPVLGAEIALLTLGSQIGNPAVRNLFGGRLVMPNVRRWFHLYNPHDRVLTAEVRIADPRYTQLFTEFDQHELNGRYPGEGDWTCHNALGYLTDQETQVAWETVTAPPRRRATQTTAHASMAAANYAEFFLPKTRSVPQRRALIVGIDEYANPANNLDGCVNDAFLMSSLLQSTGFEAEDIRLVLNDRATLSGIRDRLEWLLEGAQDGDLRFLHYSGHGTQIPTYGVGDVVDGLDECLAPYDFDGSRETAVVDDWFYELYAQLPYGCRFFAVFDCCHSGGISRAGAVKVRGLNLADDIRHRALRWDAGSELWVPRELVPLQGSGPAKCELGHANCLRGDDCYTGHSEYYDLRARYGHSGPFKPVIYKACQEAELAEEYRHGNHSYGAFTFALVETLRRSRRDETPLTFRELSEAATEVLHGRLDVRQTPAIEGPQEILNSRIPLSVAPRSTKRRIVRSK